MLERAFDAMPVADGNFVQQFQTTGFDARVWELYLCEYLVSAGFDVERLERPDFFAARQGVELALEATTSNPTQGREIEIDVGSEDGLRWLMEQYMPVKYGSALYSKLRERYWEEERVQGRPFVLAIQSFAVDGSLTFSSSSLGLYLYGRRPEWFHDAAGRLHIRLVPLEGFDVNNVQRPANFFGLPDAEHVCAVLFSNSGTIPKFSRMGYQEGIGTEGIAMFRVGSRYVHDPDAAEPAPFRYEVGNRIETWGEGLEVFHNPNALHPLEDGVFPNAADHRLENEQVTSIMPPFHPIQSTTVVTRRG